MKVAVIYYSRTGKTKKIAEELAYVFGAGVARVLEKKDRKGIKGYFGAGKDAILKKEVEIEPVSLNPQDYELIFIGTPVWAGGIVPAIRTYLKRTKIKNKKIGFFCTTHVSGINASFKEMTSLLEENQIVAKMGFNAFSLRNFAYVKERIEKARGQMALTLTKKGS